MTRKGTAIEHLARRRPPAPQLVIGVDGGGTSTRAVIIDEQRRVVAEGHAGPSNPLRVGIVNAASAVREAIDKTCAEAGIQRTDVQAATIGLAGVRRADIRDRMRETLAHSLEIESIELVTDGDIALYGATGGGPGLVVISGTGSICCGMNNQGKRICAGGWGPIVGDEGAGSWIARRGLQAVARAADQRGPKTSLSAAACEYFRVSMPDDLAAAIYAPTMSNDRLAGFGKSVVQAAERGDVVARDIVTEAGQELAVAAIAVIRRLRMERERFPVACVGGVFAAGELVREPLRRELGRVARKAELSDPIFRPVIAAARMARGLLDDKLAVAV